MNSALSKSLCNRSIAAKDIAVATRSARRILTLQSITRSSPSDAQPNIYLWDNADTPIA